MHPPSPPPVAEPGFAHEAERQLARLFDFYGIAWAYEPRTFELAWDAEGRCTSAFTPDFHLPDHDVFIEVTTLRQPLVTAKNRKLRRLRELHPDVRVILLYRRDYEALVKRFGLQPAGPAARV